MEPKGFWRDPVTYIQTPGSATEPLLLVPLVFGLAIISVLIAKLLGLY